MQTKILELNKRYTWEQIVEAYPELWVFLTESDFKDGYNVKSGVLVAVSTFEKREATHVRLHNENIKFVCRRTTFAGPKIGDWYFRFKYGGFICSE